MTESSIAVPEAGTAKARSAGKEEKRKQISWSVFGAASAVYALFYTFCLYRNASGITYPFFVAGTLCYLFFCLKRYRVPSGSRSGGADGQEAERDSLFEKDGREKAVVGFYAVSLLLLGISVCMTDDWKILGMTKTGIFLLTVTLALRCFACTRGWSFAKYLCALGRSITEALCCIDTPFSDAALFLKEKGPVQKHKNLKYILLGAAAAVPLLIVILALLLSADAVFYEMFRNLLGDFRPKTAALVCLTAAAAYVMSYSFMRGLAGGRAAEWREREKKGEPVAAVAFTALIAAVYLIFCVIQAVYLFAGRGRLPEGLTWSSYARQGFFQLMFVCLINLALVLFCLTFFRDSRALKVILTAISLMTYILIASSAYRMILYIQNYYLTFLRVLVLWVLAVTAVVFAGVIAAVYRKDFPLFGFCTVAVTVLYIILAFAKPDYWIAKYDLAYAAGAFAESGQDSAAYYDDFRYLEYHMSADAAPVLLAANAETASGEGYEFEVYARRMQERTESAGLRSFNFSRQTARRLLGDEAR